MYLGYRDTTPMVVVSENLPMQIPEDGWFPEFSPMMWGMTSFASSMRGQNMKLGNIGPLVPYMFILLGTFLRFKMQPLHGFWKNMISLKKNLSNKFLPVFFPPRLIHRRVFFWFLSKPPFRWYPGVA